MYVRVFIVIFPFSGGARAEPRKRTNGCEHTRIKYTAREPRVYDVSAYFRLSSFTEIRVEWFKTHTTCPKQPFLCASNPLRGFFTLGMNTSLRFVRSEENDVFLEYISLRKFVEKNH